MPTLRSTLALATLFALAACSGEAPSQAPSSAGLLSSPTSTASRPVQQANGQSVRAVGVMVNGPTRARFGNDAQLAFMGSMSKTRVALELYLPGGGLIGLDEDACELAGFSDDRGTDLAVEEGFMGPFESMPQIAEDGQSMVVVAGSGLLPAQGAGRLRVRGSLSVTVAHTKKTHRLAGAVLESGRSLQVGSFTFEVTETGPSEWSDGWSFTVKTPQDPRTILSWSLTDAAGNEREVDPWMTMYGNDSTSISLKTEEPDGPLTLTVEAWDDARTVRIPFDVSVGLGLR